MNEALKLSTHQAILLDTDGTVTDLIRLFTGETIEVTKLTQDIITDDNPPALLLAEPKQLLHRRILLRGSKNYLYAESFFVIDHMSDYLRRELLESQVPIGLLWQQEKLETFREILEKGCEHDTDLAQHFPGLKSPVFLARSYRIYHGGVPLGVINEKFPREYFNEV